MGLKIAAVTGSRADWGLIVPVLKRLRNEPCFELQLFVTGQHITSGTHEAITKQGFEISALIDMNLGEDDSPAALTEALGGATARIGRAIQEFKPDLIMVTGDRYEMHGAAVAAVMARVPLAHLFGGDVTEGAIDEQFRHSMTKLSHIHFVSNKKARARLIQMGEDPARVHLTGSPSLDHIHDMNRLGREEFFGRLDFSPRKRNFVITLHPVTQEEDSLEQCREMLEALEALGPDAGLILTGSNADPQGRRITAMKKEFAASHDNAIFRDSLGTEMFLNALIHADAMIGNSSAGLYEAPAFNLPTINIGNRQKGRERAESVMDCAPDKDSILRTLQNLPPQKPEHVENPYGDGHSAEKIVRILKTLESPLSCVKQFHDMTFPSNGDQ